MSEKLIIVESPGKVKCVKAYAGSGHRVLACYGHVRDLPEDEIGIDTAGGFEETYRVTNKKAVSTLKAAAHQAETIYLAMDPDREGEAIAWHICQLLPKRDRKKVCRISFNAITKEAVQQALAEPAGLNLPLVEAARTRRSLDRLIGYPISHWLQDFGIHSELPLSAGRVQTAALRFVVDRRRHQRSFASQTYYTVHALLGAQAVTFEAKMSEPAQIDAAAECQAGLDALRSASVWWVADTASEESAQRPPKPLITSSLQQLASRRLNLSPGRSQSVAQELYEAGLITYLRTDSTRVAPEAAAVARAYVSEHYGPEYLPESPPQHKTAGGAQDAHECIRPADIALPPDRLAGREDLSTDAQALYGLIWQVFMASQMAPAIYRVVTVLIRAGQTDAEPLPYTFRARARSRTFDGFEAVFNPQDEEEEPDADEEQADIPPLQAGHQLSLRALSARERHTKPKRSYTQAELVRALEIGKIGRPSTYAGAVEVLLERGYAEMQGKTILPTALGEQVLDALLAYYPKLFDLSFTASMEALLDQIAAGKAQRVRTLEHLYNELLAPALARAGQAALEQRATGRACPECGAPLVRRNGKRGPFAGCSAYPACAYSCDLEPTSEEIAV